MNWLSRLGKRGRCIRRPRHCGIASALYFYELVPPSDNFLNRIIFPLTAIIGLLELGLQGLAVWTERFHWCFVDGSNRLSQTVFRRQSGRRQKARRLRHSTSLLAVQNFLEDRRAGDINRDVIRWKAAVALALMLVWASCGARCHASLFSHATVGKCCDETGEGSARAPGNSAHCVCAILCCEGFVSDNSDTLAPTPNVVLLVSIEEFRSSALARINIPAQAGLPPPELIHGWQFLSRAAASPRAPSALS